MVDAVLVISHAKQPGYTHHRWLVGLLERRSTGITLMAEPGHDSDTLRHVVLVRDGVHESGRMRRITEVTGKIECVLAIIVSEIGRSPTSP